MGSPREENGMSEVIVVGSFSARPGREQEAEQAFEAILEPTHAEDGCVLYALHRGIQDPRRLTFIERWSSQEALAAHLDTPHIQAVLARAEDLFEEGGEIVVYEALPGGQPKKGSLAAHAAG
jgi:quinol monooxygenase YgiN